MSSGTITLDTLASFLLGKAGNQPCKLSSEEANNELQARFQSYQKKFSGELQGQSLAQVLQLLAERQPGNFRLIGGKLHVTPGTPVSPVAVPKPHVPSSSKIIGIDEFLNTITKILESEPKKAVTYSSLGATLVSTFGKGYQSRLDPAIGSSKLEAILHKIVANYPQLRLQLYRSGTIAGVKLIEYSPVSTQSVVQGPAIRATPELQRQPGQRENAPKGVLDGSWTTDECTVRLLPFVAAKAIAVDCEGRNLGRDNSASELALIQLAALGTDPIAIDIYDLTKKRDGKLEFVTSFLREMMESPRSCKVFHDARCDVQAIEQTLGIRVANISDTQVRAGMIATLVQGTAGKDTNVFTPEKRDGLAALMDWAKLWQGAEAQRKKKFHDAMLQDDSLWLERPLRSDLVEYALDDVRHLLDLDEILKSYHQQCQEEMMSRLCVENCSPPTEGKEYSDSYIADSDGKPVKKGINYAVEFLDDETTTYSQRREEATHTFAAPPAVVNGRNEQDLALLMRMFPLETRIQIENLLQKHRATLKEVCEFMADAGSPIGARLFDSTILRGDEDAAVDIAAIETKIEEIMRSLRRGELLQYGDGEARYPSDDRKLPNLDEADRETECSDIEIDIDSIATSKSTVAFANEMNSISLVGDKCSPTSLDLYSSDNRLSIPGTLHRISRIVDRDGVVGYSFRIGKWVQTGGGMLHDIFASFYVRNSGDFEQNRIRSCLMIGRPGSGKTTVLREAARYLSESRGLSVIVVDTSGEICGGARSQHPSKGTARIMPVLDRRQLAEKMIEAVQNHSPEVVIVDELASKAEALAAKTISQRGVAVLATVHGQGLENLLKNNELNGLAGGLQPVLLSSNGADARFRKPSDTRSGKCIVERAGAPPFDLCIEVMRQTSVRIHHNMARSVDAILAGKMNKRPIEERCLSNGAVFASFPNGDPSQLSAGLSSSFSGVRSSVAEFEVNLQRSWLTHEL